LQTSSTIDISLTICNGTGRVILAKNLLSSGLAVPPSGSSRSFDLGILPGGPYILTFVIVDNLSDQGYSSPASIQFSDWKNPSRFSG
jgi:hypothetical protein